MIMFLQLLAIGKTMASITEKELSLYFDLYNTFEEKVAKIGPNTDKFLFGFRLGAATQLKIKRMYYKECIKMIETLNELEKREE